MSKKPYSLEELYEHLKRYHLSDSLYLIGSVNAAFKYGFQTLYTTNIPPPVIQWINQRANDPSTRMQIYLTLSRMARFLLLSGANDHKGIAMNLYADDFRKAYGLVVNLHDPDIEPEFTDPFALNKWFGRTGQWQFPLQASRKIVIGRGYALFIQLAEKSKAPYDFDEKFKFYYGLSLFEFMATGYALWLQANATLDYEMKVESAGLAKYITPESQLKVLKLSSGSAKDYRTMVRGEDWKTVDKLKDIYGMDPFVQIPAISIEQSATLSSTSYVIPQSKYFLDRTSSGIFYLLANKEQAIALAAGHTGENPFRNAFGKIYRSYVGLQLNQGKLGTFIDLDDDFTQPWKAMIPDFALVFGTLCLLVEVKTSLLNIEARTYFEPQKLELAIQDKSLKKAVEQLALFRQAILDKKIIDPRFQSVERVLNIVVGYDDVFTLNSSLLTFVIKHYPAESHDLQFACISDIDALGRAVSQAQDAGQLMADKIDDPATVEWAIATHLEKFVTRENPLINVAYKEFMNKLGANIT